MEQIRCTYSQSATCVIRGTFRVLFTRGIFCRGVMYIRTVVTSLLDPHQDSSSSLFVEVQFILPFAVISFDGEIGLWNGSLANVSESRCWASSMTWATHATGNAATETTPRIRRVRAQAPHMCCSIGLVSLGRPSSPKLFESVRHNRIRRIYKSGRANLFDLITRL